MGVVDDIKCSDCGAPEGAKHSDDCPRRSVHPLQGQLDVFEEAMAIHEHRTVEHGDLWKQASALELAFQIKHKALRLQNATLEGHCKPASRSREELSIDSALDLINYAAFYIRATRQEHQDDVSG